MTSRSRANALTALFGIVVFKERLVPRERKVKVVAVFLTSLFEFSACHVLKLSVSRNS